VVASDSSSKIDRFPALFVVDQFAATVQEDVETWQNLAKVAELGID
jgi:hypothetical protein